MSLISSISFNSYNTETVSKKIIDENIKKEKSCLFKCFIC